MRQVRRVLVNFLYILAALYVFVMEWLFAKLKPLMASFAKLRWIAAFESWFVTLTPFWTMVMLFAPGVVFFPLKFVDVWLFYTGHWIMAIGVILFAKVVGTAIFARLFVLSKDKMMTYRWFAWAYNHWTNFSAWAHEKVRMSHAWQTLQRIKVTVKTWMASHRPGPWGRRFRAAMNAARRKWRSV